MTTREDFEREWAVAGMPKDKQRLADAAWQACAAHFEATINTLNDAITEEGIMAKMYADLEAERNALLALIAEKDKALNIALDITSCDYDLANACDKISYALSLTHDSVRLVPIKWEARTSMDGSYFPGAFVPITEDQYNSEEWSGFERRVLYTIVKGEAE